MIIITTTTRATVSVPGRELSPLSVLTSLFLTTFLYNHRFHSQCNYPQFTDGKAESKSREEALPRSESRTGQCKDLNPIYF